MAAATRAARERGASTLEFVLTMPLLLLFLMLSVQVGLVAHAQNVAKAAADEGAADARTFNGTAGDGQARTEEYLGRLAPSILTSRSVSATRTADTASVTVNGTVISLVPGWKPTITQTSTGPVERFVEEDS